MYNYMEIVATFTTIYQNFIVYFILSYEIFVVSLRLSFCSCSKTDEKHFIWDKTRHIFNKKLEDNVRKYASNFVWRNRYWKGQLVYN